MNATTSSDKKLKVLYLTGMYPVPTFPQQGIFCHEQVKALKALGHDVTVAVPIPFYSRQRETSWCYEGVIIQYIRYFKLPGARDFHNTGKALFRSLQRRLDLSEFDLYHADAPLPAGHAAMLASQKYGKPFVVHCHGLDVFLESDYGNCPNYYQISKCAKAVYDAAAAIVGVSKKTLNNIIEQLPLAEKCFVVYNGVDVERFHPEEKKNAAPFLRVVSVGNLVDLKGHDISIRAVGKLITRHNLQIQLDIFGRGPKKEELLRLANELGIAQNVSFKGYVPYDKIAKYLREYDVFLLPSWYEAIGCVYLEAMASGVLTIGCWENGIDEVISDKETGFLVRPHSVEDVVATLKGISDKLGSDSLCLVAEKGRCIVARDFTWKKSAEKLTEIYRAIT